MAKVQSTPSPVQSPRRRNRELSARPTVDSPSSQIAHTLTACCRCRHVCCLPSFVQCPREMLKSPCSAKHVVTPVFPAAALASEQIPSASTLINPKEPRFHATMSSTCNTRLVIWRPNWNYWKKKTMNPMTKI
jgi:hypothetical protein